MNMNELIVKKDYNGIEQALAKNPGLANDGIAYDEVNIVKEHPLHRICDRVFSGILTDEEGVKIAQLFLKYGANINGDGLKEKKDTPLLAASSLHADQVAILYIEKGANIHHGGCYGGTALHWAAWTGRPKVVQRLVDEGAEINRICIEFKATPLFWAIHGFKNKGYDNLEDCLDCVRILLGAGADKKIPNLYGYQVFHMLNEKDLELNKLLSEK